MAYFLAGGSGRTFSASDREAAYCLLEARICSMFLEKHKSVEDYLIDSVPKPGGYARLVGHGLHGERGRSGGDYWVS